MPRPLYALVLLLAAVPAASRDLDQDQALALSRAGRILPLECLLESALARYPGARLLEVELEEEHERYVYEIELLTPAGLARELEFDAASGQLLKDEVDR